MQEGGRLCRRSFALRRTASSYRRSRGCGGKLPGGSGQCYPHWSPTGDQEKPHAHPARGASRLLQSPHRRAAGHYLSARPPSRPKAVRPRRSYRDPGALPGLQRVVRQRKGRAASADCPLRAPASLPQRSRESQPPHAARTVWCSSQGQIDASRVPPWRFPGVRTL